MCCAHVSKNRQAGFTLIGHGGDCHLAILADLGYPKWWVQSDKATSKLPKWLYPPPQMPLICLKVDNDYPTTQEGLDLK